MHQHASSLPERWIQSLWAEMRANYGGRWDRMFPVPPCPPDVDPAAHVQAHIAQVQAVWARKLGRFQFNPKAIRFALDNLPDGSPPDLPAFVALCNRRPDAPQQALPAPKADPERVQQVLAGISRRNPITPAQRETYRRALRLDRVQSEVSA
jgi:hypothetical protein